MSVAAASTAPCDVSERGVAKGLNPDGLDANTPLHEAARAPMDRETEEGNDT